MNQRWKGERTQACGKWRRTSGGREKGRRAVDSACRDKAAMKKAQKESSVVKEKVVPKKRAVKKARQKMMVNYN